jgi:import inner membrane translocase subunit TIM17
MLTILETLGIYAAQTPVYTVLTEIIYSPWVILSDFGGAFSMGAVGGGIWHGIKGARNSPRVSHIYVLSSNCLFMLITTFLQGERWIGAVSTIKARAPVTGGNFGVWGGMFSTFDCAVKGWRQKEDAWNAIISGFLTGGCLAARSECHSDYAFLRVSGMSAGSRHLLSFSTPYGSRLQTFANQCSVGGPRSAFGSAIACGILLGVFEGVGVLLGRVFSEQTRPQLPQSAHLLFLLL